jgi:hypothetical protein
MCGIATRNTSMEVNKRIFALIWPTVGRLNTSDRFKNGTRNRNGTGD